MSEEIVPKRIEDPVFLLLAAKSQIENVLKLIEGNEYESYMNLKLTSVWYELDRQLKNMKAGTPGSMSD
jgi:hypothetical protein